MPISSASRRLVRVHQAPPPVGVVPGSNRRAGCRCRTSHERLLRHHLRSESREVLGQRATSDDFNGVQRSLQTAAKSLISMVGAQGLEPWTR